jgi:hypothetical protein
MAVYLVICGIACAASALTFVSEPNQTRPGVIRTHDQAAVLVFKGGMVQIMLLKKAVPGERDVTESGSQAEAQTAVFLPGRNERGILELARVAIVHFEEHKMYRGRNPVLASYPNTRPNSGHTGCELSPWAMYASARSIALPFTGSRRSSSVGMSVFVPVTSDDPRSRTDISTAAVTSSIRV